MGFITADGFKTRPGIQGRSGVRHEASGIVDVIRR